MAITNIGKGIFGAKNSINIIHKDFNYSINIVRVEIPSVIVNSVTIIYKFTR
jgi:hypothetical protein